MARYLGFPETGSRARAEGLSSFASLTFRAMGTLFVQVFVQYTGVGWR